MDDVINEVTYKCQACGKEMLVPQGSRIRYCDTCMLRRIKAGVKQPNKGGKK